jgi:hypothetical protein
MNTTQAPAPDPRSGGHVHRDTYAKCGDARPPGVATQSRDLAEYDSYLSRCEQEGCTPAYSCQEAWEESV